MNSPQESPEPEEQKDTTVEDVSKMMMHAGCGIFSGAMALVGLCIAVVAILFLILLALAVFGVL